MMKLDVDEATFPLGESRPFSFVVAPESIGLEEDAGLFRGEIYVDGSVMNTGDRKSVV